MNLNSDLIVGDNIPAKLIFENHPEIEIIFQVEDFSEGSEHTSH